MARAPFAVALIATTAGVNARTDAVRGTPIASATSPNVSPGRRSLRGPRLAWFAASTPAWNACPTTPPAPRTRAIRGTRTGYHTSYSHPTCGRSGARDGAAREPCAGMA